MTVSDLCVLEHRVDPDRPRPALDGLRLCWGHRAELERLIVQLPRLYDDLDAADTPTSNGGHGNSHPGLDIDERAADLRSQIHHDLLWWCLYVVDTRGLTRPLNTSPRHTAVWLTVHLDWLAADPRAAVELLPVLRELTGRAYGITDLRARRLDLDAQCLVHRDGERCEGIVTLVVRGDDWTARCPVCRERQDATPYLRLARRGQWITAEDVLALADLFGIPCSDDVVRQWKHRKRIRGRLGPDGALYDLRSVQRYLVQRQAERQRMSA